MDITTTRSRKKEATRAKLLHAASRQIKTGGFEGTSIDGVMSEAGLTRGSFYAYFDDKDDLVLSALKWAIERSHTQVSERIPSNIPAEAKLQAFLKIYLSPQHREMVADGCPVAALSRDISQSSVKFRKEFAQCLSETIDHRRRLVGPEHKPIPREKWMAVMSSYIGALLLSRACEGTRLSDEISQATFDFLTQSLSEDL
jgi:TetR/AcrR family transcriptional regulator, transcriptional repressor for nem operon